METIAKIQLSPQEMELVQNSEWILAKHSIIKKVYSMFGDLNELINAEPESFNYLFPEKNKNQNGKISKGENYRHLPYVILDYPAFFDKENIFAVRTIFCGEIFLVSLCIYQEFISKNLFITLMSFFHSYKKIIFLFV